MNQEICAIIPALNEEETIAAVVSNLYKNGVSQVFVVDNGSTDQTEKIATEAKATVVKESQKGYGKACLSGIAALPASCDWVLFCDADGSDDLNSLPSFWKHLDDHDFIIGNRRSSVEGKKNLTSVQNFGNWLSGFLMKIGWGKGFSDLGPLRAIRKESLDQLKMQDENFGWTVEMQAKSIEAKLRTQEVPVSYFSRQGGVSKISGNFKASFQAGIIILSTLGKFWLERSIVQKFLFIFSLLFLISGTAIMGCCGDPASASKGPAFMIGAILMITGFLFAVFRGKWSPLILIPVALLTRLLLLPMPPGDDIWRYIWEGLIQSHGHNPYNTPPSHESLSALRTDWWQFINHPDITAIYPPLAQLIFKCVSALSPTVLAFKLLITAADIAIGLLLLKRYGSPAVMYLLNPMVIYCFAGGAHYESLFMLPLVIAFLLSEKATDKPTWNIYAIVGLLVGASIFIKIVSILAGGFIGWKLLVRLFQDKKGIGPIVAYILGIITIPIASYLIFSAFSGLPHSLTPDEFTKVARNTSFVPWLFELFNSSDKIIPNTIFAILLILILIPVTLKTKLLVDFVPRSTVFMLAFAPMVHAWYFTWAIPFAIKRHRLLVVGLSITGWLYFLYPYRLAKHGEWLLHFPERLLIWAPLIFLWLEYKKLREI